MSHEVASSAPTLEQVAQLAGVSRSTVSRVVNDAPRVKKDAVEAVQAAIKTLNYVPNRAARSLASRRTQVIALVVPETAARFFADPFFASVVQGSAVALADTEYTLNLVVASETNPEKTRRYLLGGNVDGALVVSHHSGDHSWARLGGTLPVVFGGRPLDAEEGHSYFVDVDNCLGADLATQHLIDLGRRRIATIAGRQDMPAGLDRLEGWRRTLRANELDDSLVAEGDFSVRGGAECMRQLLDRDSRIDAVFAANDQMGCGAVKVLHERGLSVPADVAVVGFDGDYFGDTLQPPLTTVTQPSIALGAKMAEVLMALIDGRKPERVTLMRTELKVRQSTVAEIASIGSRS